MEDEYEPKKHIPDELLFEEILVHLPVKSLLVYKSVCKTWLYTIESRSFIEAHRRHHCCEYSDQIVFTPFKSVYDPVTKSSSLLPSTRSFGLGLIEMTSRPLDVMLPPEMTRVNWPNVARTGVRLGDWTAAIRVLGPIRTTSIYCVVSYLQRNESYGFYQDLTRAKIAICNPSTRDYKLASPFPLKEMPRLLELTATRRCRAHYGFGVAADGDYKVVVVVTCPNSESILSYVYSLRQGAWKKIVDSKTRMVSRLDLRDKQSSPYIHDYHLELCPQVFLNGCWHWIATFMDNTWNVLTFNVDSEMFNLVRGPPSYRERKMTGMRNSITVSVLNGHLVLLNHMLTNGIDVISVWMMMEYGDEDSWINVWRVNVKSYGIQTLVGITYSLREDSNGGIQIQRVLFQDYANELVSHDEFGEVEQLGQFDTSSCIFWNTFGTSAYSETLECLSPSKYGTDAA